MTRRRTPTEGPDSWKGVATHLRDSARLRADLPGEGEAVERALLELAGRVHGKRVLVQGAESAALERALAEQGGLVERALDPLENPLPRGPFELVLARGLDQSKEPERALRALGRVLHPRGRMVLALAHPWHGVGQRAFRSLPELLAALRESGVRAVAALEPEPAHDPNAANPAARHLVLLAERTGRRGPNRGTSG